MPFLHNFLIINFEKLSNYKMSTPVDKTDYKT